MSKARRWAEAGFVVLAIILIVISFLPLWWTDHWWVRLWDFPRLQVAGLLLLAAGVVCSALGIQAPTGIHPT